jgi:hypothetical protein
MYLDESEGDASFVASGWACRAERWDDVSAAWQEALDASPQIPYFKINDAMGLKGPFLGWSDTARDEKVKSLARVIPHENGFFGHGCYTSRTDFDDVKPEVRRIYKYPYFFCVATAMVYAVAGENQIAGADKIDFVLDRSNQAIHMRKRFYSELKPRFPKMGECIDLDDKETPALQAADLSAGLLRQLYEPNPRSIPGSDLLEGVFLASFELHKKGLADLAATSLFKRPTMGQAATKP